MKRIQQIIYSVLIVILASQIAFSQGIEFEALFDQRYAQKSVSSPRWMNDGTFYTALAYNEKEELELRKYNITKDTYEVYVTDSQIAQKLGQDTFQIEQYQFSASEEYILFQTEVEYLWRRSSKAYYYFYNVKTGEVSKLGTDSVKIGNVELAPKGLKVAYTKNNNLYLFDIESKKETAVTTDGEINKIINGSTDWVYEEEFSFAKAWFWSPDGNRIAYYRFDESEVREFYYTYWTDTNYPEAIKYKYPKAGEKNADVKIGVFDLNERNTTWIDLGEEEHYVVRVDWTNSSDKLALRVMNRLQNEQDLYVYTISENKLSLLKNEKDERWIEENDALTFLKDGKSFIYMSEEDGYNHLYLYSDNGKKKKQITKGEWDVTGLIGINQKKKLIYYMSAEVSPLERHLYSIKFTGKGKKKLTKTAGVHSISMSKDQKYYIDYYSSAESVQKVSLHDSKGKELRILEDNNELEEILKEMPLQTKEFMKIPLQRISLNAYMLKPPNFDETRTYPVLMFVYGGPGSQTVRNSFDTDQRSLWHQYLAGKGYIVVSVDNRGTGARGADFKKVTYKNLGDIEIADQIASAKYLASLPFVDKDRIGIWGWSYGGFMSTLGLIRAADIFKAAIAVAPVIDWRYYDTIYTERYMQTPQLNPAGYKNSSPIHEAEKMKGKYLLIHGTGDDNVHFQNAVSMVDALQASNIPFETMYYPNRNHGIYGGNTRRHLYSLMTKFIFENL